MTKYRIDRRKALGLMGGAVSLAAVPGARVSAQSLDKVSYQTNWRAQAEHGGFYLARENGIYKKHGIDCDLRMGGPQQNPSQLLLGGRVAACRRASVAVGFRVADEDALDAAPADAS